MGFFKRNLYVRGRLGKLKTLTQGKLLRALVLWSPIKLYVVFGGNYVSVVHPNTDFKYLITSVRPAFSSEVIEFVRSQQGKIAIDIGANVGLVSAALSRRFGQVFSFEPDERCHLLFHENLSVNSCDNVTLIREAVSASDGAVEFALGEEIGHSTIEKSQITKTRTTEQLPSITLDQFADEQSLDNIDLVKIDVEGHEFEVLQGASKLLQSQRLRCIIMEHSPALLDLNRKPRTICYELLGDAGYHVFDLKGNRLSSSGFCNLPQTDVVAFAPEHNHLP